MNAEGFHIVQGLSDLIDRANSALVNDVSARVAAAIAPWVLLGLVASFLTVAASMMRHPERNFDAMILKCARWYCVVTVALGMGLYQGTIAPFLMTGWDRFAAFIVPGSGSTASMVDKAVELGMSQLAEIWARVSWSNWMLGAAVVVLFLIFCIVIGIGTIYVVIAKFGVGILVCLAPAYVGSLISNGTARFFTMWVGQWINYGLLVVCISMTFTVVASIIGNFVSDIKLDESQSVLFSIGGAIIASLAGGGFLVKVNNMVSALAGGASLGGFLAEARAGSQGVRSALGSAGRDTTVPIQGPSGVEHAIQRTGRSGAIGATHAAVAFLRR